MRKVLFLLTLLSVLGSCSKDNDKEESKLKFLQIKMKYATDYVGNQHYIFNIKGNNYRLVVVVKFTIGYVFIRWIGTHKEYDKIDCSTI